MQRELTLPGPLLAPDGHLAQIGWARQPILDCNLKQSAFYPRLLRWLQPLRTKRWDYYALFTPTRFFSATIADLGYAANVFIYTLDFASGELHEEGLVLPAPSVRLPRNSNKGVSRFEGRQGRIQFNAAPQERMVSLHWPGFNSRQGVTAEFSLCCPPEHQSMNIVIPIGISTERASRFYYNRKINNMPATGYLRFGDQYEVLHPSTALGSLDWGRGVWDYQSYWNWASSSGFLPDGRALGLNFGRGFGDLSAAGENALIIDGTLHKLGPVSFDYTSGDYMQPWRFKDDEGRLDLTFTPFKERTATSNLLVIYSQVHQMFGRYSGSVCADDGELIKIDSQIGFAEEHQARW